VKKIIGSSGETYSGRLISGLVSANYIGSKCFSFVFNSSTLGLRVLGSVGLVFVFSGIIIVKQLI
jgi:hypothetical protein